MKPRKLTTMAITVSLAIVLSWVDRIITSLAPLPPGIKLGLANVAVVFALYKLGVKEAAIVSSVRVCLMALLFGSLVSMIYGLSGALLSLVIMSVLKGSRRLSPVGVSVAGGVAHNIGQISAACILLRTSAIAYYLPVLILTGTLAGVATGIAAGILIKRLK